jgi:hypothetical protein
MFTIIGNLSSGHAGGLNYQILNQKENDETMVKLMSKEVVVVDVEIQDEVVMSLVEDGVNADYKLEVYKCVNGNPRLEVSYWNKDEVNLDAGLFDQFHMMV